MKAPRIPASISPAASSLTSAFLILTLLCPASGRAQTAAAPDAQTLARYDKNKNGRLDADEIAAMQSDQAKAAQTPVAAAGTNGKDVVQLSPFQVNGGDDKGYFASSTLSGTRLDSKLEDLASSITVVTKQQLLDTASVDLNDIFLYESNTEGTGQFTDMTNDGRGIYDNVAGNPQTANRIRGLSSANIAVDGFSATSTIRWTPTTSTPSKSAAARTPISSAWATPPAR
jgi:outer membrane receptor for ferric coprogen and ferric-rhodotorulic acid